MYVIFLNFIKFFTDLFFITYLHFIAESRIFTMFNDELTHSFEFQLIFLFLISKLFYDIEYYKHQYLSIIILTVFELLSFIFEFSGEGFSHFFLFLHCHIIYSFLKFSITVYIKGLIGYKYISPYKARYFF